MIHDTDGIHIVASAGHPQPEPGRWPTRMSDHPSIVTWLAWRGRVYCTTPHPQANGLGQCKGCLATHRTIAGIVLPHTPSPPQFTECWVCHGPLDPPSYTWAPHPECGNDDELTMDDDLDL